MREIEIFYLTDCPYCRSARKAIGELIDEHPAYAGVGVRWIEERADPEAARSMDYYYVPAVFCNGRKLYEARPGHSFARIKAELRQAFEQVLRP
ncbi:MAG: glutaredoxin [Oscillospiraceae bacterium]|nr:glutaredoxin [Oscillospiraceae bacterium]